MKNPTPANPTLTDTLLFEHFATLATAPDGIARLRELILQLAVQGKLGTQDAGDEPASNLIKKIQKEKSELIEKRKLRENKITELKEIQEMKYEIPSGWSWHRMGDVVFFQEGPGIRNWQFRTKGVKLLNVSNILSDGKLNFNSSDKYVSEEEVNEKYSQFLIEDKDLLLASSGGSWGKVAWFKDPGYPIILNTSTVRLRFYSEKFAERYLQYFMQTSFFRQQMVSQLVGMQPNFGSTHLSRCYIPLPPLAEQHRIVAKVDRLMALCDELEARQQQEQAGCLRLGTASLAGLQNAESPEEFGRQWAQVCDVFDLVLDCPENVAVLRQTILQLAVQGRLVRQEPGDEPAGKLVKGIKHEKQLVPIQDQEKPYSIPDLWTWIRLGEAVESMANGIYKPGVFYSDDGIACLRMYNINSGKINFKNLKRMVLNDLEMRQYLLKQGDLLVNRVNSRELVGKAAVIPDIKEPVIFESKNIRVRFDTDIILPGFVNILFQTKEVWQVWQGNAKQTCGQASVSQPQIAGICTPLPPLAEQHRIVAKVDALMALCDALESRLKERAGVQGRLAGSIVKGIV